MMRYFTRVALALVAALSLQAGSEAFTSRQKSSVSVTGSGVTATQGMTLEHVTQGTGDPGTVVPALSFGVGSNDFRDSGESIRIEVDTNLAGNRIIIYTDNLNGAIADPQAQVDTSTGIDGGGLVGVSDPKVTVPLLWALQDSNATNYAFASGIVGDDEIYVTDRAHVATFVDGVLAGASAADKQALDTLPMRRCDDASVVANPDNAGTQADPQRYPQFFGAPGIFNSDLCSGAVSAVTIAGVTMQPCAGAPCPADSKVPFAEELSKNIAVVAFGCFGTACDAPNLATADPGDSITVTSPFYLPIAADFRDAPGQDYTTSTLTVDLVTQ